jgi:plasmid maintenance system antidote protein VapI
MARKNKNQKLDPIHPGRLLREELEEVGVSNNKLGRDLRVPVKRIGWR